MQPGSSLRVVFTSPARFLSVGGGETAASVSAKNVPCSRLHHVTEDALASAFECFQQAAKCEEQARNAQNEVDRAILLATAEHWRTLGNEAKEQGKKVSAGSSE